MNVILRSKAHVVKAIRQQSKARPARTMPHRPREMPWTDMRQPFSERARELTDDTRQCGRQARGKPVSNAPDAFGMSGEQEQDAQPGRRRRRLPPIPRLDGPPNMRHPENRMPHPNSG